MDRDGADLRNLGYGALLEGAFVRATVQELLPF
jgi:hypothetical protein